MSELLESFWVSEENQRFYTFKSLVNNMQMCKLACKEERSLSLPTVTHQVTFLLMRLKENGEKNPLCSCECLLLDTLQVAKDMSAEKTGGFEKRGCQKRWSSADSNYFSIYEFDSVMHTTVCV